jgi:hypothetical protein
VNPLPKRRMVGDLSDRPKVVLNLSNGGWHKMKLNQTSSGRLELEGLRQRLRDTEETLDAIRSGEVDALVVTGPSGDKIFTLKGAEHPYREVFPWTMAPFWKRICSFRNGLENSNKTVVLSSFCIAVLAGETTCSLTEVPDGKPPTWEFFWLSVCPKAWARDGSRNAVRAEGLNPTQTTARSIGTKRERNSLAGFMLVTRLAVVGVESVNMGALNRMPEVIMPSQFFESAGAKTFSSEQRLMLAILTDAVNILREYRSSPNRNKRKSFNEVSLWVFINASRRSTGFVSFDHVCDALGLNAENLRARLALLVSEPGRNFRKLRLNASMGRRRGTI